MNRIHSRKKLRNFILWAAIFILIVIGTSVYLWQAQGSSRNSISETAQVRLGDYLDYVSLRGEITVRSSTLIKAPYNAGQLQILKLVRNGSQVKKGDIVVEFDASSIQQIMDQYRSALAQAETEIERIEAQQSLQEERNITEAITAGFALERAKLDLGTKDIVPAIEHERNLLAVERAEQRIEELKTKSETSRVGTEADLAGARRKREKAIADLKKAEDSLANLTLRSPIDGTINLLSNSNIRSSILVSTSGPVFKVGDSVWAGASIAEIPDLSTIQVTAPVYEAERGKIQLGQAVLMRVEAVPDREHEGTVSNLSPITKIDYTTYPYRKSFEMKVDFIEPDPRLKTGMTVAIRVETERLPDSIMIPAAAVFDKGGRKVAYVTVSDGYEERPLQLSHRSDENVRVVEGLTPGERVALKDPTLQSD
ncbi:MAG: efflux RND transporter periplasmic adaptor subunit [Acidobacteriota bacterium]